MNQDQILQQLNEIFCDIFDDDAIVLTRGTTADDIKEWDSANHINIIVSVEGRFKIKISNAEVERLKNIGDFVDLIAQKTGSR